MGCFWYNFDMADFSKNLVKRYRYWEIYVHENQGYLGRCVIWCKRPDALDLADATSEEQGELFVVLNSIREAARKVFQPDWFNYSFLGNETRHLHGHFIPRYEKPKKFLGTTFEDKLYGHNYKTDHSFQTSSELLATVRDKLKSALS
jgi:diadenosine tetraphosphate (Ap4A) HIT family hydrolase